jgi:hypothetical protein
MRFNNAFYVQVYGCDTTNIVFMRPGSVAVTVTHPSHHAYTLRRSLGMKNHNYAVVQITPYCWDNAADFEQLGDAVGETIHTPFCAQSLCTMAT